MAQRMSRREAIKSARAFVSTHPFGAVASTPLELLEAAGVAAQLNEYGRKIRPEELARHLADVDFLLAGTERLDTSVLKNAARLKLISRIGIGLDGIDFDYCRERGIRIAYTPDAPTVAVAELIVGVILDCLRRVSWTDSRLRAGVWYRHMGGMLRGRTVGLLGFGRIGKTTARLLRGFGVRLLACDPVWDVATARTLETERCSFESLLQKSDILSLCLPLDDTTRHYIGKLELEQMKPGAVLVNTARGGIVDEVALFEAISSGHLGAAGVDVYEQEPYDGPLKELDNVVLTCHMGAATVESRTAMETEAVEEVLRFVRGEPLKNEVWSNK